MKEVLGESRYIEISATNMNSLHEKLTNYPAFIELKKRENIFELYTDESSQIEDLSQYLLESKIPITHLVERRKNLERHFLSIIGKTS